jgi:hypothetical protein
MSGFARDIGERVNQVLETRVTTGNKYIGGTAAETALKGNPNYVANMQNWVLPLSIGAATLLIGFVLLRKK